MNREETKKAIAVMLAFVEGKNILVDGGGTSSPRWEWYNNPNRYEIEPDPPILYRVYQYINGDSPFYATGILYKNSPHDSHNSYRRLKEQEEKQGIIRWISDWIELPPIKKD